MYHRPIKKGSPLLMSHVKSVMKDVKVEQFQKMMKNMEQMVKDSSFIKEYKVLEE